MRHSLSLEQVHSLELIWRENAPITPLHFARLRWPNGGGQSLVKRRGSASGYLNRLLRLGLLVWDATNGRVTYQLTPFGRQAIERNGVYDR